MLTTDKEELLIGLIGDTHLHTRELDILTKVIDDFKEKKVDYILHLGDFSHIKVYQELQEIFGKEKLIGIVGNMDDSKIAGILPKTIELELFGHRIFITHGEGGPHNIIKRLNGRFDLSQFDIIIFGHAHRPFNEKGEGGKLYLSPGTPTDKRFTDINSYGYLKISNDKVEPEIIYL